MTFFQDLIGVEGVASIDVCFDLAYIYMSVMVFEGESGFLTAFFPLFAAIMKVNDAFAKRTRKYCSLKYTCLSVNFDARKAKVEGKTGGVPSAYFTAL